MTNDPPSAEQRHQALVWVQSLTAAALNGRTNVAAYEWAAATVNSGESLVPRPLRVHVLVGVYERLFHVSLDSK